MVLVALERRHLCAGRGREVAEVPAEVLARVPDLDSLVAAARREPRRVAVERDAQDHVDVAAHRRLRRAGQRVPQHGRPVAARRRDAVAVGAEADVVDVALVFFQSEQRRARRRVPDPRVVVERARDDARRVAVAGAARQRVAVALVGPVRQRQPVRPAQRRPDARRSVRRRRHEGLAAVAEADRRHRLGVVALVDRLPLVGRLGFLLQQAARRGAHVGQRPPPLPRKGCSARKLPRCRAPPTRQRYLRGGSRGQVARGGAQAKAKARWASVAPKARPTRATSGIAQPRTTSARSAT